MDVKIWQLLSKFGFLIETRNRLGWMDWIGWMMDPTLNKLRLANTPLVKKLQKASV